MHRHTDPFKDIYFKEWSTQVWKLSPHDSLPTHWKLREEGCKMWAQTSNPRNRKLAHVLVWVQNLRARSSSVWEQEKMIVPAQRGRTWSVSALVEANVSSSAVTWPILAEILSRALPEISCSSHVGFAWSGQIKLWFPTCYLGLQWMKKYHWF